MTDLATVVAIYLMGVSSIGLFGARALPAWLESPLSYVGPAVFAALALPAIAAPGGVTDLSLGNGHIATAVVASLAAWRTNNVGITVVVGLVALAGYHWLV